MIPEAKATKIKNRRVEPHQTKSKGNNQQSERQPTEGGNYLQTI